MTWVCDECGYTTNVYPCGSAITPRGACPASGVFGGTCMGWLRSATVVEPRPRWMDWLDRAALTVAVLALVWIIFALLLAAFIAPGGGIGPDPTIP